MFLRKCCSRNASSSHSLALLSLVLIFAVSNAIKSPGSDALCSEELCCDTTPNTLHVAACTFTRVFSVGKPIIHPGRYHAYKQPCCCCHVPDGKLAATPSRSRPFASPTGMEPWLSKHGLQGSCDNSAAQYALSALSTVYWCPANAISQRIAKFHAFDGTTLLFSTVKGATYNLLTEQDHMLNVLLDDFGVEGRTYVRKVAFNFGNTHKVLISSSVYYEESRAKAFVEVEYNGIIIARPFPDSTHKAINKGDFNLTVTSLNMLDNTYVVINTPLVQVNVGKHDMPHLDVKLSISSLEQHQKGIHGLLGQTLSWVGTAGPHRIQGAESEYIVTDLFACDFWYNSFYTGLVQP